MEEHSFPFAPRFLFSWFSYYTAQDHRSRDGATHSGLDPPISIDKTITEMPIG